MAKTKIRFSFKNKCSLCGKGYRYKYQAKECENRHKEKRDLYYTDYEHKNGLDELEKIASDPRQRKLTGDKNEK